MALVQCKDCNQQFSTDAKRCPACGAKKPKTPKVPWKERKALKVIVSIFLLSAVMNAIQGPPPKPTPEQAKLNKQNEALNTAKYYCREMISKALHDPESVVYEEKYAPADYGGVVKIKGSKNLKFEVQTVLRARNKFGAYTRNVVECEYLYTPEGKTIPMGMKGL